MIFETTQAILWIQRLAGFAIALQSLEFLWIRKSTASNGIWSWDIIRSDFAQFPQFIQKLFDRILAQPAFSYLLWMRLGCSIALIFFLNPLIVTLLLLSTILILLRWRGTFNGGSDYMMVVLLSSLWVASISRLDSVFVRGALFYIALQTVLSYFIAGLPKFLSSQWRSGRALQLYLTSSNYTVPKMIQSFARTPGIAVASSWIVIIFELSFPLVFLSSDLCLIYIGLALIFHLLNAYIFGLNRFIYVWAAAYPALYFCSQYGKFSPWH